MDLLWPGFLGLLGLIPLVLIAYFWMQRRRKRYAVRFSSLSLVKNVAGRSTGWRRYVPLGLFLLALVSLVGALARPVTITRIPTDQTTIILAIDVSRSMRANDIQPSRLEAAQAAAIQFVQHQKPGTQIGLVAFSGFAELVQPPTTDQEALDIAIESLTLGRRTAIGSGILRSLAAISEIYPNVAPPYNEGEVNPQATPVPKGAFAPAIIVLLTDGVSNSGMQPLDAAQQAADRGVRVYTIGFGTDNPSVPNDFFGGGGGFGGNQFGNNGQQQGGGNLRGFRLGIDEETLKKVADMTDGKYYLATSANELQKVFDSLPTHLIMRSDITEISVFFAAAGGVLAFLAFALSLAWHPLP
jgi:Ca-activated chloride channel family protein